MPSRGFPASGNFRAGRHRNEYFRIHERDAPFSGFDTPIITRIRGTDPGRIQLSSNVSPLTRPRGQRERRHHADDRETAAAGLGVDGVERSRVVIPRETTGEAGPNDKAISLIITAASAVVRHPAPPRDRAPCQKLQMRGRWACRGNPPNSGPNIR